MSVSWVLIIFLQFDQPSIALSATSRTHCLQLMEYAKTVKEYYSSVCMPQWDLDKVQVDE